MRSAAATKFAYQVKYRKNHNLTFAEVAPFLGITEKFTDRVIFTNASSLSDKAAVLRDEGGGIVLGESQDGGQGADQDDVGLAAFRPLSNLNPIDQRSDDVHGLRARRDVG